MFGMEHKGGSLGKAVLCKPTWLCAYLFITDYQSLYLSIFGSLDLSYFVKMLFFHNRICISLWAHPFPVLLHFEKAYFLCRPSACHVISEKVESESHVFVHQDASKKWWMDLRRVVGGVVWSREKGSEGLSKHCCVSVTCERWVEKDIHSSQVHQSYACASIFCPVLKGVGRGFSGTLTVKLHISINSSVNWWGSLMDS